MRVRGAALLFVLAAPVLAAPPADPKELKLYNHCREWLGGFPASYIATNIRGEGVQYKERRMAALDMVREKRDFGTVYDLMVEVDRGNFLAPQIIDILVEWKSRRAIPVLERVAADRRRPVALRKKAGDAAAALTAVKPDAPPTF